MEGPDILAFQSNLNLRYQLWDIGKRIGEDGDYGSQTRRAAQEVCIGLGIDHGIEMQHGVTPELRSKLRDPEKRTPEEITRAGGGHAKEFRARLRRLFDGDSRALLTGVDVSNHQATVDWDQVKAAGHMFAFHKVSEGLGSPDRRFGKARWAGMRDAGLVRGAYHFARPQKGRDPKREVDEFCTLLENAGGLRDGDLQPVLDIEAFGGNGRLSAAETLEWARGFVHAMRARLGVRPIIYTGAFWRDQMGNPSDDLGCRLWLAAYVDDPKPFIPRAWADTSYAIWQHTDKGRCAGLSGGVDLNRLPGGHMALDQLRM
jgi:lysozyme